MKNERYSRIERGVRSITSRTNLHAPLLYAIYGTDEEISTASSSFDDNVRFPSADNPHLSPVLGRNNLAHRKDDCQMALLRGHVLSDGTHFPSTAQVRLFGVDEVQLSHSGICSEHVRTIYLEFYKLKRSFSHVQLTPVREIFKKSSLYYSVFTIFDTAANFIYRSVDVYIVYTFRICRTIAF